MSLATSIKDFSDTLNDQSFALANNIHILPFLQELFVFSIKTIISGVVYILTFEWFKDFSYLPLLNPGSPQPFEIANTERLLSPGLTSSYSGESFFTDPISHFFSFCQSEALYRNSVGCKNEVFAKASLSKNTTYIFSGLANSFFFSLPFSLPHLISIKRLFSQGIQAAVASLIGVVTAHSLFLIAIFYGLRFLIIPWFSLEPVTYTLGFTANVLIIKELIQTSPQRFQKGAYAGINTQSLRGFFMGNGGNRDFAVSPLLLRIGFLSFLLTWCEELNVFSSITNLTLDAQNTYLDLYPSTNVSNFFGVHTLYIFSFIIGNCVFSLFFYYLLFNIGPVIASWTNFSNTKISNAINKLVMLFIITFTFASFPYYGLDYLIGKIGGFLPEDPVYKETVLSPTKLTVNKKNTLFIKAESADKKKHTSLLDINNFDNGVYLNNLDFNKFDNFPSDAKGSISRTTSFEKSNYRQENAWIRRNYLARLRARPRKNSENNSTTSFYKAFQDPKAYYQKIQLESDRKQNKSIREIQSKNGSFVRRQEGILAEEPTYKMQSDRVFPLDLVFGNKRKTVLDSDLDNRITNKNNNSIDTELDPETNIFAEKYTKGVKRKNSAPLLKKSKALSTKNIIKRKFFLNPVYRSLLQTDIDTFMARQPLTHNIAENQDYDLYKKRVLLEKYYNWLRCYSPLQKDLQDVYNISSTKSFVDSVFHHQFKGTLKIAKRLFPVTFDPQQNNKKNRVLSYDQTLYKDLQISENPLLHEELEGKSSLTKDQKANNKKVSRDLNDTGTQLSGPNLQKQNDLTKQNLFGSQKHTQTKSELDPLKLQEPNYNNNYPFIEESDSSPFYAGWDDTLRRFVVTNKFFIEK